MHCSGDPRRPTKSGQGGQHTDGRDGGDDLTKLELVEDGGLAGGIETNHEDAHLFLLHKQREEAEKLGSRYTHLGGVVR